VILGNVQLVTRRSSPIGERDLQSLKMAENAALQMGRLVADLLDAARIGAGQFTMEREPTNLAAVALQVVEEWQALTPDRRIQLDAPASLECFCDGRRVQQLLTNLLTNAIKYSLENSSIRVEVVARGAVAQLSVTDEGSGIPPEDLDRLFRAFSRIGANPNAPGIGLGLYIARGIVEGHHGEIGVESKEGETTFWATLPLS
jgi:signal transduction histidine kinase